MAYITFDKDTHTYFIDSIKVPSVTQVLKDSKAQTDYSKIPKWILKRAGEIGNIVHEVIHGFYMFDNDLVTDDTSAASYLDGFVSFLNNEDFSFITGELILGCPELMFAGTVDLVGTVNERLSVVDIKTTNKLNLEYVELQTAAYQYLYEVFTRTRVLDRYVLHLNKKGDYNFLPCLDESAWNTFKTLVEQYHDKRRTK